MLSFNLKLFRTKVDINSIIRDYIHLWKLFLLSDLKTGGGREAIQTVCDIEITGTPFKY